MNDPNLIPLLRASIEIAKAKKARKELHAARLNFWLARAELAKAVRELEKTLRAEHLS